MFAQIEQQVSDLRDLAAPDIGPPDVITRDELAVELEALFDETWTDEQLAADNLTLRAMGLLTEEQDIRELTEQLYAGQVLGFYDFEDQRMVVVTDAGLTAEAQITYAHEFTHAMQDAAFDTGAVHDATAEDDDQAMARLALEEGDAVVAMFQWAFGNLGPDQLGRTRGDAAARHERHPELDGEAARVPVPGRLDLGERPVGVREAGMRSTPPTTSRRPRPSRCCIRRSTSRTRRQSTSLTRTWPRVMGPAGSRSSRARWARRCWASGSALWACRRRTPTWPRPAGAAID